MPAVDRTSSLRSSSFGACSDTRERDVRIVGDTIICGTSPEG